ncbi:MAG: DUF5596 domain-containing protein [Anaerolineae bacterium]|nr:DUF5596 domain-containing protein [Anaerolineae bacterium]
MNIEILNPQRLAAWCERIALPQDAIHVLVQLAGDIQQNGEFHQLFEDFYTQTVLPNQWHTQWEDLPMHPRVVEQYGDQASLFYFLAYLSALPHAYAFYQAHGIDPQIFDDTMADLRVWLLANSATAGKLQFASFPWVWRHLACKLFRLGRLQYMLIPFAGGVTALRHRQTGAVTLLADPNLPLRSDGHADGAGNPPPNSNFPHPQLPPGPVWTPLYEVSQAGWRGHPINPYGCAQKKPAFFPSTQWEVALAHGDPVLDMHIPASGAFTVDSVRDSLKKAQTFFAQLEPQVTPRALFCHTWFFTPQLQTLLPSQSNIVRFQREFYLYPNAGGPGFLWNFVFGETVRDFADAPRDTSLRRDVLDWLASGKPLFDMPGVAFHGPEDWGNQPYMTDWDRHPLADQPDEETR